MNGFAKWCFENRVSVLVKHSKFVNVYYTCARDCFGRSRVLNGEAHLDNALEFGSHSLRNNNLICFTTEKVIAANMTRLSQTLHLVAQLVS